MEKKVIKQNNIVVETTTESNKNLIKLSDNLLKLKKLEGMVSMYKTEIESIKELMKASPYDKITIIAPEIMVECNITKYDRETKTLNKELVRAAINNVETFEACFEVKKITSVMVKVK